MAGIFLSYDRDDAAKARAIATALEKSGHSVWWDLHVRGGAQFSKVIEEALRAADAVVVLWSKNSVESAWVRDEAAAGRDSARLVPATIDGTQAPLGFRQFQTIDLTDWKRGERSRGYNELQQAIVELAGEGGSLGAPFERERTGERPFSLRRWALVMPVLAGTAAVAGYLLWPSSSAAVPAVGVVPASGNSGAQELARDLFATLGQLQSSNPQALQLVEEDAGHTPDLIFKIDGLQEGGRSKASLLLLSGRDHTLLWSGNYEQPSDKRSDLRQRIAFSAANVLDCAAQAYGPNGKSLDEPTRRLYLSGCGAFTDLSGTDPQTLVRTFREVTRRAPAFEDAWGSLLNSEDEFLFAPPYWGDDPQLVATFAADIAAARKVNPDIPEGYVGESDLSADSGERIRILDLAIAKNPDNPTALSARSLALMQVGRMSEAVTDARRAVRIRPFSARTQESYIAALTYSGQFETAQQELSKADALWPGATNIAEARYRLNLRYGSAQEALKHFSEYDGQGLPGQELFLKARINPTPANVSATINASKARVGSSVRGAADYMQTLATFGRTDELIEFVLGRQQRDWPGVIGVMFRPAFRDFWRDPRSMRVAAHVGLIKYWRSSGHWPDFCSWADLAYDCKKEAAKLGA